jgi:hypothetical protein
MTYCEHVTFGITGDRDSTPDIDAPARGISDSLAELVAAARRSTPLAPAVSSRPSRIGFSRVHSG